MEINFIDISYMKIGIVGNGFVGKATGILSCHDIEIMVYGLASLTLK